MRAHERAQMIRFEDLSAFDSIIDVRSPGEFALDHLPGSINCPVLNDDERVLIGTLYKQVDPFVARRRGAVLVSRNIAQHIETTFANKDRTWTPLVLCWRGGMRSGSMTTVLRAVGWEALQLPGGYKRWRSHVLEQLEHLPATMRFRVICGPTGSGKSRLLQAMHAAGGQVLDLERLAAHRGSVLGELPDQPQPAQRLFETRVMTALQTFDPARPVFVEAESRRIGMLHVPAALMLAMRASACLRIAATEAARVRLLLEDYEHLTATPARLIELLGRLREVHGAARIEGWIAQVEAGAFPALVEDLLRNHYDALYQRSSHGNYTGLPTATVLDGGSLTDADFARLAGQLVDV